MADGPEQNTPAEATPTQPSKLGAAASKMVNSGSLVQSYGGIIGAGGLTLAVIEVFRADPKDGINLFATYGPKYVLWAFIAWILYDLLKRGLAVLKLGADNIGIMAQKTGEVATSVQAVATKNDRTAEEMRRLCSFSASQSERAVELSRDAVVAAEKNTDLLHQVLNRLSPAEPTKESTS